MCTHSIDDLLPYAPLHYAATGEMVKGSFDRQGTKCDVNVSYLVCAGCQFTGIIIDHIMLLGLYTGMYNV